MVGMTGICFRTFWQNDAETDTFSEKNQIKKMPRKLIKYFMTIRDVYFFNIIICRHLKLEITWEFHIQMNENKELHNSTAEEIINCAI